MTSSGRLLMMLVTLLGAGCPASIHSREEAGAGPTMVEVLSVPRTGGAAIAPDGRAVAYSLTQADWERNRYDTEIFVWRDGGAVQLTDHEGGSSWGQSWSPDGQHLAFMQSHGGSQIFIVPPSGGEARQLTKIDGGVSAYRWSPDGQSMALLLTDPPTAARREREDTYGAFTVEDSEQTHQHLWFLNVERVLTSHTPANRPDDHEAAGGTLRRLTGGDFTVGSFFGGGFRFTPDGSEILFDHAAHGAPDAIGTQDISAVDVKTGRVRSIVRAPGIDNDPYLSPDGQSIVFHRAPGPNYYFRRQYHLAIVPVEGGEPTIITQELPDEASLVGWHSDGILFRRHSGVETQVYRMDPETRQAEPLTSAAPRVHDASVSADGRTIAFVGEGPSTAREVYLRTSSGDEERLTRYTEATDRWPRHDARLVRWNTADGTEIEGVLYLPDGHEGGDPPRPLIVLLHGGPATPYRPVRVHQDVYPVSHWLQRGAFVLAPNYRGSGGYGDAFMAANVRRLGEAYAEDVLSGVEMLVKEGLVDPKRLGAAGWSAGGDAAAYLATTTNRFAAISVGAGTTDLTLDYASNDQPLKLREYMQTTPWRDPDAYARLSPLTYAADARTPTLIQHGRNDKRVSLINAMALYRALRDGNVPVRLVIYDDAGHGLYRPRDRLAAKAHNSLWFDAYLWGGGKVPDLTLEN